MPRDNNGMKMDGGYPIATIAYYCPDDKNAPKVAVGIDFKTNTGEF